MKKYILSALLCLLLLAAGCAAAPENTPAPEETPAQTNTPAPENDIPAADAAPGILQRAEPAGESTALSYIPNDIIEESLMQEIAVFQDGLLSWYSVYDAESEADILHLRYISLDTGALICQSELKCEMSYAVTVQICGERIAVSDALGGTIHILDGELRETETWQASGDRVFTDPSAARAYCLSASGGIRAVELSSGREQTLLENAGELALVSQNGRYISVRYIDLDSADRRERYAGLDLETGEVEFFEIDDSFAGLEYSAGLWAGQLIAEDGMYFAGTQQQPYRFRPDGSYAMVWPDGERGCLLVTTSETDGAQTMTAYGTDGSFISGFSTRDAAGSLTSSRAWLETAGGYLLTVIDSTGHDRLYFWDLSAPVSGSGLEMTSYYEQTLPGGEVLEQRYYDRAAELSEKYGVDVRIADQCPTEYSDKTALQELDPARVEAGLDTLEKALSAYPDGFFSQLYYGAYRIMEIHLVGAIENAEEIEGYSPTAFVQHENGKITMVLNINVGEDALLSNVYHESSHIIDKVLEHDALYREDALFSEKQWQSMNPPEFTALSPETGGYYDSYEIMPMEYFQEVFSSYFVIDYGKSFSTEDRATVFEAAMNGSFGRFPPEQFQPLYAKLEYYCRCIRDCFNTEGWPEQTAWELALTR